jgi:hypothetical protein
VQQSFLSLNADVSMDELAGIVAEYARYGLLVREEPRVSVPGLRDLLDANVLATARSIEQLSAYLREGRAVVIPDALPDELAQRVYGELSQSTHWKIVESCHDFFHHRNSILSSSRPRMPAFEECAAIFEDVSTRRFINDMSGHDCTGQATTAASWYRPGEYALPHNDIIGLEGRSVAYIWYLTKEWRQDWGGALYWCPSGQYILPTFNTLVIFNVTPSNMHMVCPVAPGATSKRLTVNGFWHRGDGGEALPPIAPEASVSSAAYGPSAAFGSTQLPVVVLGAAAEVGHGAFQRVVGTRAG